MSHACFTSMTQEIRVPSLLIQHLCFSGWYILHLWGSVWGLNMTCMSHPLLDLIALHGLEGQMALKFTCFCERAQQCKEGWTQGACRLHTLHTSALKRSPFMLNLSSVNTILHAFVDKRRQSICGKQFGLIYFFCSSGQVQDEMVEVECGKPHLGFPRTQRFILVSGLIQNHSELLN